MFATTPNSAPAQGPLVRTTLVGELVCHMCGTTAGSIESEHQPLGPTVRFKAAGSDETVTVLNWRRLRCTRCRGALYVDDLNVVRRRLEPLNIWEEDRPRRGRPPKWLVEKRQREREAMERTLDEQQAA